MPGLDGAVHRWMVAVVDHSVVLLGDSYCQTEGLLFFLRFFRVISVSHTFVSSQYKSCSYNYHMYLIMMLFVAIYACTHNFIIAIMSAITIASAPSLESKTLRILRL